MHYIRVSFLALLSLAISCKPSTQHPQSAASTGNASSQGVDAPASTVMLHLQQVIVGQAAGTLVDNATLGRIPLDLIEKFAINRSPNGSDLLDLPGLIARLPDENAAALREYVLESEALLDAMREAAANLNRQDFLASATVYSQRMAGPILAYLGASPFAVPDGFAASVRSAQPAVAARFFAPALKIVDTKNRVSAIASIRQQVADYPFELADSHLERPMTGLVLAFELQQRIEQLEYLDALLALPPRERLPYPHAVLSGDSLQFLKWLVFQQLGSSADEDLLSLTPRNRGSVIRAKPLVQEPTLVARPELRAIREVRSTSLDRLRSPRLGKENLSPQSSGIMKAKDLVARRGVSTPELSHKTARSGASLHVRNKASIPPLNFKVDGRSVSADYLTKGSTASIYRYTWLDPKAGGGGKGVIKVVDNQTETDSAVAVMTRGMQGDPPPGLMRFDGSVKLANGATGLKLQLIEGGSMTDSLVASKMREPNQWAKDSGLLEEAYASQGRPASVQDTIEFAERLVPAILHLRRNKLAAVDLTGKNVSHKGDLWDWDDALDLSKLSTSDISGPQAGFADLIGKSTPSHRPAEAIGESFSVYKLQDYQLGGLLLAKRLGLDLDPMLPGGGLLNAGDTGHVRHRIALHALKMKDFRQDRTLILAANLLHPEVSKRLSLEQAAALLYGKSKKKPVRLTK